MNEKKTKEITFVTFICIIIILLLVLVIIGMYLHYNNDDKLTNSIKASNNVSLDDEVKTEVDKDNENYFSEGRYLFCLDEEKIDRTYGFIRYIADPVYINFENGEFTSYLNDQFIIYGQYENLENGKVKCYIKEHEFPESEEIISLKENNWTIDFLIQNDTEIKVESVNFGEGNSELSIILYDIFGEDGNFAKYEEEAFLGEWKSEIVAVYSIIDEKWEETELVSVLGTIYHQFGSNFIFNNGEFNDFVFPITENDKYREGTYTFDGFNKFELKYSDDPSNNVEIYIVNKDTIVYKTEDYMFFMCR